MTHGKQTCKILKEIRQQIADKNEIEYVTSECHFQGECQGTCPKCEAEVRYLENELNRRRQLGKAVAVAGISLCVASTFSACNSSLKHKNTPLVEQETVADTTNVDTLLVDIVPAPGRIDNSEIVFCTVGEVPLDGDIVQPVELVGELPLEIDTFPIYRIVEVMSEYPGGMEALYKYLRENLIYPEFCKQNNIQGTVVVEFVIDKTGKIGNAKVIVPLHPDCDKETIRVVKEMPDWTPAKQNGKPVAIYYNLPIKFVLNDEK